LKFDHLTVCGENLPRNDSGMRVISSHSSTRQRHAPLLALCALYIIDAHILINEPMRTNMIIRGLFVCK